MTQQNILTVLKSNEEAFEKCPLLLNLGVRLEFQSAKYYMYVCG